MKFHEYYWLLAALLIVPLCMYLVRVAHEQSMDDLTRVIAARLRENLLRSVDYRKRKLKAFCFILGLAALLTAIARPLYGFREIKIERAGVDMIVALDISRSMMAEDAGGTNRLGSAKMAISTLLDRPSGDRIGLIAFAGEAFLMAPATQDHEAVRRSLMAVNTRSVSKEGSDISLAIKLATRSYEEGLKDGKALIIITDGEELQGDAVIAAREAAGKGISVFTVGVGSAAGAKVPAPASGPLQYSKNEFGREVISRMNERVLQQVAAAGHGFYAPLGLRGEGLIDVDERGLQPLAKGTRTKLSKDMREYFQWPLGLALAFFMWEMLVSERKNKVPPPRKRVLPRRKKKPLYKPVMKSKTTAALLLLVLSTTAHADLREAEDLMKQNQPGKAEEFIQSLLSQKPNDPWLQYNAGVTAYAAGDFQKAEEIWQKLATAELPPKLRNQIWLQIGNASFREGEPLLEKDAASVLPHWEQSREALRVAQSTSPKNKVVANNLKVVERELERLHRKLANQLIQEAQKPNQPLNQTIDKLQAALDHQQQAQALSPKSEEVKAEVKKTEQMLAEKFAQKAVAEEKKADDTLTKPDANQWEKQQAEEHLNTAMADFNEAKALDQQNKPAEEGEKRVEQKLADLKTQQGKQLQQQAEAETRNNPDKAVDKFEQALDKFQEALNLDAQHEQAKNGQEQVKKELEQLHMKEGDRQAEAGRRDTPNRPEQAAEELMTALQHYQQAQQLNPDNQEVKPKIDAIEKALPEMLVALGKKEQNAAEQAEPKSMENAVAHLEKAATSFEMAKEVAPKNEEAQKGEEQVQDKLAQLREAIAKKTALAAKQQAQQNQQKNQQPGQGEQNFQAMLAKVKNDEKQKEYEQSRRAQSDKYNPQQNKNLKNW